MIEIDYGFLITGYKWSSSEIQNLQFNFADSTPLYMYTVPAFVSSYSLTDSGAAFSSLGDPAEFDQRDVTRFLLLENNQLTSLSGQQTLNLVLVNTANTHIEAETVNYRVYISDVISVDFWGHGFQGT